MAETPNHDYTKPERGAEDWDDLLNQNFDDIDADVEIRDTGGPTEGQNSYTPTQGAKYFDTQAGDIYLADGNTWTLAFSSIRGENTVRAPAGKPLVFETNGGDRTLRLGVPGTDGFGFEAGGNVVAGHPNNTVNNGAVGVVIGGGGDNNGFENTVGGDYATVGGGKANTASDLQATVGGGVGNTASAQEATVPGGLRGAAESNDTFVWNDGTDYHQVPNSSIDGLSSDTGVSGASDEPTGANTFSVSATSGVRFITGSNAVTYISAGSTGWATTSSRAVKTNIDPVEPQDALAGVDKMEIATWEYESDDGEGAGTTHIGPMAEEFHDAFDVGSSDEHINSINADGVALAAIQGLSAELDGHDDRIENLESELAEKGERIKNLETTVEQQRDELAAKDKRIDDLETRLAALEDQLSEIEQ